MWSDTDPNPYSHPHQHAIGHLDANENMPSTSKVSIPRAVSYSVSPEYDKYCIDFDDLFTLVDCVVLHRELLSDRLKSVHDDVGWRAVWEYGRASKRKWAKHSTGWQDVQKLWEHITFLADWEDAYASEKEGDEDVPGINPALYFSIIDFLREGIYPHFLKYCTSPYSTLESNFRRTCANYTLDNEHPGRLFYNRGNRRQYVLMMGEVESVVKLLHEQLGHAKLITSLLCFQFLFNAFFDPRNICRSLLSQCKCACSNALFFRNVDEIKKNGIRIHFWEGNVFGCRLQLSSPKISLPISYTAPKTLNEPQKFRLAANEEGIADENGRRSVLILDNDEALSVARLIHHRFGHLSYRDMLSLFSSQFAVNSGSMYNVCPSILKSCSFCKSVNRQLMKNFEENSILTWVHRKRANLMSYRVDVCFCEHSGKRKINIIPIGYDEKVLQRWEVALLRKSATNYTMNDNPVTRATLEKVRSARDALYAAVSKANMLLKRSAVNGVAGDADISLILKELERPSLVTESVSSEREIVEDVVDENQLPQEIPSSIHQRAARSQRKKSKFSEELGVDIEQPVEEKILKPALRKNESRSVRDPLRRVRFLMDVVETDGASYDEVSCEKDDQENLDPAYSKGPVIPAPGGISKGFNAFVRSRKRKMAAKQERDDGVQWSDEDMSTGKCSRADPNTDQNLYATMGESGLLEETDIKGEEIDELNDDYDMMECVECETGGDFIKWSSTQEMEEFAEWQLEETQRLKDLIDHEIDVKDRLKMDRRRIELFFKFAEMGGDVTKYVTMEEMEWQQAPAGLEYLGNSGAGSIMLDDSNFDGSTLFPDSCACKSDIVTTTMSSSLTSESLTLGELGDLILQVDSMLD